MRIHPSWVIATCATVGMLVSAMALVVAYKNFPDLTAGVLTTYPVVKFTLFVGDVTERFIKRRAEQ